MIYTKRTNFPYPLLANNMTSYKNAKFDFDVELKQDTDFYYFTISYEISSDFIKNLLASSKAKLMLIIKSKDNQFHELDYTEHPTIRISISKLALNTKTTLQLMIIANEDIPFTNNDDIDDFYDSAKHSIIIKKGKLLGFSDSIAFDEEKPKSYELFEKKVDPAIKSKIKIEVGEETIIIYYQSEDLQFVDNKNSRELNYPYLYSGLQKALVSFIYNNCDDKSNPEDGVDIENMAEPIKPLEIKLYDLMTSKNVKELNMDNIDEVIHKISDNLILRWTDVIRGLSNED